MRIIHLLQSDKYSGAESIVCQIIDLFRNEPDIEMIYVSPDGSIREELERRRIEFYPIERFSQENIDLAIRELKPDIIHAHDFNASVRASRYKHMRVISHLHNNPLWLPKLCKYSIVYALSAKRYEKIIGVSDVILKEYLFKNRIKDKFVYLPNIVDSKKVLDQSTDGFVEPIDILYVGRLSDPKNPIGFLKIIKKVLERSENKPSVVMLGVGPLQTECDRFIRENGMNCFVEMRGFDANPYKYMNASKILIMPSKYEGFGLVAVEAMVLGKTVLASPVGGLVNILKDGGGILCEDEDSFVENTINLLWDENKRREIGIKAQISAERFLDKNGYKETLKEIYLDREQ